MSERTSIDAGRAELILALEPIGGIAGDMCLAALLHLGDRLGIGAALREALQSGLRALASAARDQENEHEHGAQHEQVARNAEMGMKRDGPGASEATRPDGPENQIIHEHEHEHVARDAADLAAVRVVESSVAVHGIRALHVDVSLPADIAARQAHHRPWRAIRSLLFRAQLPALARARALAAFTALAEAEARVHDVAVEEVEFHEVGGLDSIVDLAGTAILLEAFPRALGFAADSLRIVALPPPLGSGTARSAHGIIPVPAPATLELLRGRATRASGPGERTTPTGAAILAALTTAAPALPDLSVRASGFGAGTKRWDDAPNLLRAVLGEPVRGGGQRGGPEALWQLEANLDDLSPQLLPIALDALLAAGAKDAWLVPIAMKKGRPAQMLCALAAEDARAACEAAFFRETTTLGVRAFRVERRALEREHTTVQTRFGALRIKLGKEQGAVVQAAPELEDCLAAARTHGAPLKEVLAEAIAIWRAAGGQLGG